LDIKEERAEDIFDKRGKGRRYSVPTYFYLSFERYGLKLFFNFLIF